MSKKTRLFLVPILFNVLCSYSLSAQLVYDTTPICIPANSNSYVVQFSNIGCAGNTNWTLTSVSNGATIEFNSDPGISVNQTVTTGCWDVEATCNGVTTTGSQVCVYQDPSFEHQAMPSTVCAGGELQLSVLDIVNAGSNLSFIWYGSIGCSPVSTTESVFSCTPDVPTIGSYTSEVIVIDNNTTCVSATSGIEIEVIPTPPSPSFSVPNVIDCAHPVEQEFINTSSSPSDLSVGYQWSVNGVNTGNTSIPFSYTFENEGEYDICLTSNFANAAGCDQTSCQTVTIFDEPTLNILASDLACVNVPETIELDVEPIGFSSITWDFNGAVSQSGCVNSSSCQATFSDVSTEPIGFSATVTYSPNCSATISDSIIVNQSPELSVNVITGDQCFCTTPTSVELEAEFSAGADVEWFTGTTLLGSGTALETTLLSLGTTVITAVATDPNTGCQTTEHTSFQVISPTIGTLFVSAESSCAGDPLSLSLTNNPETTPPSGPPFFGCANVSGLTYTVDYGDGSSADFTSLSDALSTPFSYSTEGTYEIQLIISTAEGCSVTTSTTEIIYPALDPTFSASQISLCTGESITFTPVDSDGDFHTWDYGDNCGTIIQPDGSIIPVMHTYHDTGSYTVTLEVSNGGCLATFAISDIVVSGPIASFEYSTTCEEFLTFEFTPFPSNADSYSWSTSIEGGAIIPIDNLSPVSFTFPEEGSYSVCLTAYLDDDDEPCQEHTLCKNVIVTDNNAALNFTPVIGCAPLSVAVETSGDYLIDWTFDNGAGVNATGTLLNSMTCYGISNQFSPNWLVSPLLSSSVIMSIETGTPTSLSYPNVGVYDIHATATNIHGCEVELSETIEVTAEVETACIDYDILQLCPEVIIEVNAISSGFPEGTYNWFYTIDGTTVFFDNEIGSSTILTFDEQPTDLAIGVLNTDEFCGFECSQNIVFPTPAPIQISTVNPLSTFSICKDENITVQQFSCNPLNVQDWNWTLNGDVLDSSSSGGCPAIQTLSFSDNGNYELCLEITNHLGCVQSTCTVITVDSPEPELVINNTPFGCNNNLALSVVNSTDCSGCNFTWQINNVLDDVAVSTGCANSPNCNFNVTGGIYDLELIVVNSINCTSSLTESNLLGIPPIGPFEVTPIDLVNCAPYSLEFEAFEPNTDFYTYNWFWDNTPPCTNLADDNPSSEFTYLCPGAFCPQLQMSYEVEYINLELILDTANCLIVVPCTEPIIVEPYIPEFVVNPNQICLNDVFVISPNELTSNPASCDAPGAISCIEDVTWEPNFCDTEGLVSSCQPENAGPLVIEGTATYAQCSAAVQVEIDVIELPELSFTGTNEYCQNHGEIDLQNLTTPNADTVSLDGEAIEQLNAFDFADPILLEFEYTDPITGCINSTTQEISLLDTTILYWLPTIPEVCIDSESLSLDEFLEVPQNVNHSFATSCAPQEFDSNLNFLPSCVGSNINEPTPAQWIASLTNDEGCTSIIDTTITIHPLPTLTLNIPDVCNYDDTEVTLTANSAGSEITELILSVLLPSEATEIFDFPEESFSLELEELGTYQWDLFAQSSIGCSNTITANHSVHAPPFVDLSVDGNCQFDEIFLNNESNSGGSLPGDSLSQWSWSVDQVNISSASSTVFEPQLWGEYTACLETSTLFGCTATHCEPFFIDPIPILDITAPAHCFNELSGLFATESIPLGVIDTGVFNVEEQSFEQNDLTDYVFGAPGFYEVTYSAVSLAGCSSSMADTIEVYPLPQVDFELLSPTICQNEVLEIENLSTIVPPYEIATFLWSVSDGQTSSLTNPWFSFLNDGTYEIMLSAISLNGCTESSIATNEIIVYPHPTAGFTWLPTQPDFLNAEVDFLDESIDAVQWHYEFPDGSSSTIQNPSFWFNFYGSFFVTQTVWNVYACSDRIRKLVDIEPVLLVYVPNSFTPDNDGINDAFKPSISGDDIVEYELTIWSKWGEVLFQSNDPDEYWLGNVKNGDHFVQNDVYIWQLIVRGSKTLREERTGHVTVIR